MISLIALTHNKLDVTRRCLPSWLHTTYRPLEIVLVDNGSTDGTPEWLRAFAERARAHGVGLRVHFNSDNIGCSTARNQALDLARGRCIACLDNDVALRMRNWLERLNACLEAGPGIVGPKLVYPLPPYAIQCAGVGISRSGRVQFRGRGEARDDPRFNRAGPVQCLISACWLMQRAVIDCCGGFDEAFNPVQFEDFDLCYRARDHGFTLWYEPTVEMYHFESVTTAGTASLPNTRIVIQHGLRFKERWRRLFSSEDGPDDQETAWRKIEPTDIDQIGNLPMV